MKKLESYSIVEQLTLINGFGLTFMPVAYFLFGHAIMPINSIVFYTMPLAIFGLFIGLLYVVEPKFCSKKKKK